MFLLVADFPYAHFPFKTVFTEYKKLALAVLSVLVLQVKVFNIYEEDQRVTAINSSGI
jgi:hypothetical protein